MKKLKHIKYRFLIFLKQFQADEIKLLMNFLRFVADEYNKNPLKLIDLLNYHQDSDTDEDYNKKLPKIVKVESLSTLTPPLSLSSSSDLIIDNDTITVTKTNNKTQQLYFSKKTTRIPSAFTFKQQQQQQQQQQNANKTEDDLINDRDDAEKTAINALTKLGNSFNNNDKNNSISESINVSTKCQKSNYSRISSIRVNKMFYNDSDCEDDNMNSEEDADADYDVNNDDDYDSDYVTNSNYNNHDDYSNYGLLSAMTDDDNDYDENNSFDSYNHDEDYNGSSSVKSNKNKTIQNDSIRNSNGRIRKFSERIRMELERHFQKNRYISGDEKKMLADRLNLTVRQVQKWFVHRREKFRRFEKHHGKKAVSLNHKNHNSHQQEEELDTEIKEEKIDFDDENVDDQIADDEAANENEDTTAAAPASLKFTPYIENYLEKLYRKKSQLTQRDLNSACLNLNLKQKQIKLWFQLRRQKQQQQQQFKNYLNKKKPQKIINSLSDNNINGSSNNSNQSSDLNKRQNYPEHVLRQLENAFLRNRYISGNEKRLLSKKLGLAPIQIERWFYTRRKKCNLTNSYS